MAANPNACNQCWGDLAPQNHVFPASACLFGCVHYNQERLSSNSNHYDYMMIIPLLCTFYCITHVFLALRNRILALWNRIMPEPRPPPRQRPPPRPAFTNPGHSSESDSDGVLTPPETPRFSVYDTFSSEPAAIRARRRG